VVNEAILIFTIVFAALVIATLLGLHLWLSPKNPTAIKGEPFESGKIPFALPKGRLSIKFYITAMLFLLFDIEIIFLFPWAVLFRELGIAGFIEMLVFIGILMTGFIYAWKKGALEWS